MPKKRFDPFDNREFDYLEKLVAQPSYTPAGQAEKIALVESLFQDRYRKALDRRAKAIFAARRDKNAGRANEEAEKQLRYWREEISVDPVIDSETKELVKWNNLVITRGDPEAPYHVLIPSHVDTVKPKSPDMFKLSRDANDPNRLKGLVWDMTAGVHNAIALAAEANIQPDVCAHFAFVVDEEIDSRGADAMMRWPTSKLIRAVLSQEIGPLPRSSVPADNDKRIRVILARMGRQKFQFGIQLPEEGLGHFSLGNQGFNAKDICDGVATGMKKGFLKEENARAPHPLFGRSWWESGEGMVRRTKHGHPPDRGSFDYSIHALPGKTFADQLRDQERLLNEVRDENKWPRAMGAIEKYAGGTSYDGYTMPMDAAGKPLSHPLVDTVFRAVRQVTAQPAVSTVGLSVADEDIYARKVLENAGITSFDGSSCGVISIPPRGNNAHQENEWADAIDTMRTRAVLNYLLSSPHGLRQIAQSGHKNSSKKKKK